MGTMMPEEFAVGFDTVYSMMHIYIYICMCVRACVCVI